MPKRIRRLSNSDVLGPSMPIGSTPMSRGVTIDADKPPTGLLSKELRERSDDFKKKVSLGVKNKLDIRELGIQFRCIRLISLVQKGLSLYRDLFLAALPASRRASADFTRPVFTAVAFYLCAKRHKNEVARAIELGEIVTSLGPAYIKLGQALSIRPDILSPSAMTELQKLCDKEI